MISNEDLQKMIIDEIALFLEESKKDKLKPEDVKPFLEGNRTTIFKRVEDKLKPKKDN